MAYTKQQRSEAAKRGWRGRWRRFWVTRGAKPIGNVPAGKVGVPIDP